MAFVEYSVLISIAKISFFRLRIGYTIKTVHVTNSEMLRETSTQRGVQRRGHTGEENSGISYQSESQPRHDTYASVLSRCAFN